MAILVHFLVICCILPTLVYLTLKNLATLRRVFLKTGKVSAYAQSVRLANVGFGSVRVGA
jgi:hypothetical protein